MGYATRLDGQNLFNLPEGKDSSFVRSFARKARPGERSPTLLRVSDGYTFGLKPKSGTHSPSKSSPTGMRAGSGSRICGDESRFLLRGSMGSPPPTAGSEASPYSTPFGLIPLRARNLLIEPPRKGCNLSWGSSRRERRRVSPPAQTFRRPRDFSRVSETPSSRVSVVLVFGESDQRSLLKQNEVLVSGTSGSIPIPAINRARSMSFRLLVPRRAQIRRTMRPIWGTLPTY